MKNKLSESTKIDLPWELNGLLHIANFKTKVGLKQTTKKEKGRKISIKHYRMAAHTFDGKSSFLMKLAKEDRSILSSYTLTKQSSCGLGTWLHIMIHILASSVAEGGFLRHNMNR